MELVNKDNINSILLDGESITVEFKRNVRTATLLKIISAFANTEGGVIILGYDEIRRTVIGTSTYELEIVKKIILTNKLENVCSAYIVPYKEKELIIIQVEKSKSIVFSGGGAYIRNRDTSIYALESKDVTARVTSMLKSSESREILEQLTQIYEEMQRSQQAHEKEIKASKISNWFFCILSAIIGWALGKLF